MKNNTTSKPKPKPKAKAGRALGPSAGTQRRQIVATIPVQIVKDFDALCASRGITRSAALSLLMARAIEEGI